jgi:hypothetical protein
MRASGGSCSEFADVGSFDRKLIHINYSHILGPTNEFFHKLNH